MNAIRLTARSACAALLFACSFAPCTAAPPAAAINSIGDPAMAPLMDAWLAGLRQHHPGLHKGPRWRHESVAAAAGALMFETADMAPLTRLPLPSETAPYAHQFAGDMMKAPLMIRVAGTLQHPAYIAVNKRPGSPLPPATTEFIAFALSAEGQAIAASQGSYAPLNAEDMQAERAKLDGFVADLDPALPVYKAKTAVRGAIRSDGSDGMKSLMERWMNDFERLQPGVRRGERWEHPGTLNGFHALMAGETDLAPMGRELWPEEQAAYASVLPGRKPLEIKVARGGFNTPQRTTAQAVFVHPSNPLASLTMAQLRAVLGDGGGAAPVTRWGQLGLAGAWADRPIHIYMPPAVAPNAMSMQEMVLGGGRWNPAAQPGSIADTAQALLRDPDAIGFGGLEEGAPGLKALAIAPADGVGPVELNAANAASGAYPLTRYMYIRLNRRPGQPLPPQIREFLRYVLSRDAQEPVRYSGYFPLTADEVRRELAKLD
ncbi:substrate-binding domain-containing protein [Duganella hordei]|uniref:substrate-binding domain-containing protein n=1 Tax=Duganella hordei TaxID=2865934 RepID=UPI0030EA76C7